MNKTDSVQDDELRRLVKAISGDDNARFHPDGYVSKIKSILATPTPQLAEFRNEAQKKLVNICECGDEKYFHQEKLYRCSQCECERFVQTKRTVPVDSELAELTRAVREASWLDSTDLNISQAESIAGHLLNWHKKNVAKATERAEVKGMVKALKPFVDEFEAAIKQKGLGEGHEFYWGAKMQKWLGELEQRLRTLTTLDKENKT